MTDPSRRAAMSRVIRIALWVFNCHLGAISLLSQQPPPDLTLANTTLTSGTYIAANSITAGPNLTVTGTVTFVAGGSIHLATGFHATSGSAFHAYITCVYSISPVSQSFTSAAGSGNVTVTTASGCPWIAASNAQWLHVTSGSSGSGSGTVSYSVDANTGSARNGTMTVAGQTFSVAQSGIACNYSISPVSQSFSSGGGSGTTAVTAPSACAWTATSQTSWLHVTSGSSGTGNGTVTYSVDANTGSTRNGWISVAGEALTVTQSPPPLTITSNSPLPSGTFGLPYSYTLAAAGGTPPYTWTADPPTSGNLLPSGVLLVGSVLSGAPTRGGQTFSFSVKATDSIGVSTTKAFTLAIGPSVQPIAGPSRLEAGLSFMPFDEYDFAHPASSKFPYSCPAGASIRSCFQTVLANLRAEGVSGVRIFFGLCGPDSTPLVNCGQPWQQVHYKGNLTPPDTGWIDRVKSFFQDVKDAGIQNVTLTPSHLGGTLYSMPKSQVRTPSSPPEPDPPVHCSDAQDTIYFFAGVPFGLKYMGPNTYYPIGNSNDGYNCAPKNPYFVGWQNQYDVLNAMLSAASEKQLTVFQIDFEQELNTMSFPAMARFIVDNAHAESGQSNVRDALRYYMSLHNFDPGRVTWSVAWTNSTVAGVNANCMSPYGGFGRTMMADQVSAAIEGGMIGVPDNLIWDAAHGYLPCGTGSTNMFQMPSPGTLPNTIDVHLRPSVANQASDVAAAVQSEALIDFNDIADFMQRRPSTTTVMLGEVHSNTDGIAGNGDQGPGQLCEGGTLNAPAETVAGFNQSTLAGRSVVFRPWMQLQSPSGDCFKYPGNQRVNFQGAGPYTPTQQ